jgi:hypothetical protein
LVILAGMLLARPMPALAQLAIISVQPSTVTGLTPVDLVITGADFSGAVVIVGTSGLSDQLRQLGAHRRVPAGIVQRVRSR